MLYTWLAFPTQIFRTPFSEGTVTSYIGYEQWGGAELLARATCELLAERYNTTIAETPGKVSNEDFFALGIDGNQPTLDLLREGKFSATLGVDPFRMGVTVVDTMVKVLAGETGLVYQPRFIP